MLTPYLVLLGSSGIPSVYFFAIMVDTDDGIFRFFKRLSLLTYGIFLGTFAFVLLVWPERYNYVHLHPAITITLLIFLSGTVALFACLKSMQLEKTATPAQIRLFVTGLLSIIVGLMGTVAIAFP